jgi:hypothetical protein
MVALVVIGHKEVTDLWFAKHSLHSTGKSKTNKNHFNQNY